jgi:hypothetical protein
MSFVAFVPFASFVRAREQSHAGGQHVLRYQNFIQLSAVGFRLSVLSAKSAFSGQHG